MEEQINNMKLCLLCGSHEFTDTDAKLHTMFEMHTTNGKTWKPEKGHQDYEKHIKMKKLGLFKR